MSVCVLGRELFTSKQARQLREWLASLSIGPAKSWYTLANRLLDVTAVDYDEAREWMCRVSWGEGGQQGPVRALRLESFQQQTIFFSQTKSAFHVTRALPEIAGPRGTAVYRESRRWCRGREIE